jgi:hypothetical protein
VHCRELVIVRHASQHIQFFSRLLPRYYLFTLIARSTYQKGEADAFKLSNAPGDGASSGSSTRSDIEHARQPRKRRVRRRGYLSRHYHKMSRPKAHLSGTRLEHSLWVKTATLAQNLRIREFPIARSTPLDQMPYRQLHLSELVTGLNRRASKL